MDLIASSATILPHRRLKSAEIGREGNVLMETHASTDIVIILQNVITDHDHQEDLHVDRLEGHLEDHQGDHHPDE